MIGRTLGHYEIVEKLGEGGMGAVYRARDTTLGRDVALKLLPEFVAADREKIARLEREARLLASLSHPNIATLHGLEVSSGLKYLVMELAPGDWTALPASTPVKIRDLMRRCLQKDPHRRLRDIGDARIEIDEPSASPVTVPRHRYLPWAMAALVSGRIREVEPQLILTRALAAEIRQLGGAEK
jgi:serine/threonine protein kinase